MALVLADRVRETTTTTGTGTVTLSGTAPTGYQTFSTAIGNANTTYYTINAGFQWEVGIGTYTTAGLTLSRDTVLSSSSGGALVDFAVGTKDVFVTYPAEKSVNYNASNNVGIGTTAPTRLLSVYDGDAAITKDTASAASSIIYMNKGRGSAGAPANISSGDNLGAVWFNGYSGSGNNNGYGYGAYVGGAADGAVSAGTVPGRLVFATTTSGDSSPTERMRINSSGDVGIGTNSPTGTIGAGYTSRLTAYAAANAAIDVKDVNGNWLMGTTGGAFTLYSITAGAERMRITAAGNLGLGTTTPDLSNYRTFIQDGPNPSVFMQRLNGVEEFSIYSDSGITAFNTPTNPMTFATSGIERMRISSAGNVGIGTNTPGTILDVRSAAGSGPFVVLVNTSATANTNVIETSYTFNNANTGSSTVAVIGATNPFAVGNTYGDIYFKTTNPTSGLVERMRIDSAGNVGIGTAGSGNARLTVINNAAYQLQVATGPANYSNGGIVLGAFGTSDPNYFGAIQYDQSDQTTRIVNKSYSAIGGIDFYIGTTGTPASAMRLTSAGNLGIGTTAPTEKLEVVGAAFVHSDSPSGISSIILRNDSVATNTTKSLTVLFQGKDTAGTAKSSGLIVVGPTDQNYIGSYMAFATRGGDTLAERMRIDGSGNLVLTSADNYIVTGATSQNIAIFASPSVINGTARLELYGTTAPTNAKNAILRGDNIIFTDEDASETARITASGDFGVGTTAPTTGSMSNVAILNAGMFTTFRGVVTAANNTATTIAVASSAVNVTYIVSCGIASADPVNFSAVAIVSADLGVLRVTTLQTANLMAISVSGTNIRATQNAGGAATVAFSITRVS